MPNTQIETKEQYTAYEVWRDLGYKRSLRETAKRVKKAYNTIGRWAQKFDWEGRLKEHETRVAKLKAEGSLVVASDDPMIQQVTKVMRQAEAVIDSVLIPHVDGSVTSNIKIVNADDLSKIIREYRQLVETYHKISAERATTGKDAPGKAGKPGGLNVKNLNVSFGDIPQEKRVNILEKMLNENGPDGDSQPEGGIQEGHFTEVPERGDEDGPGRAGVSGGVADSDGGDEAPVRES